MVFVEGSSSHSCFLLPESDHDHSSSNSVETRVSADTEADANEGDSEISAQQRHGVRDSPQGTAEHDPLHRQLLELVISLQKQVKASGDEVARLNARKKQLKLENAQLKQVEAQSYQEIKQLHEVVEMLQDLLQVHSVCATQA